jgi:hypothetical protein
MWLQFFAENAHFAINLLAALVCMGVCWLYLDAWSNRHAPKELFKWLGFGALGLSFLFQSTIIEQSVLGKSLLGHYAVAVVIVTRLIAYLMIITGQIIDPLQAVPKSKGLDLNIQDNKKSPRPKTAINIGDDDAETVVPKKSLAIVSAVGLSSKWLMPIGGFLISLLYWRRATKGLERHLKPVAIAFFFIAMSDLIALASLLRATTNPSLYSWVAAFGSIWWLQQLVLLAGAIVLGRWIWSYLLERLFSQLFMIFTGVIAVVFLIVSVGFTGLLLHNIQNDSLVNLSTAANVLDYALKAKQSETNSAAQQLAGSSDVAAAIVARDRVVLQKLTANYIVSKKLTGLIITNESGQVLLRGEDTERWGDSLSGDSLVNRTLLGGNESTVNTYQGVNAPVLEVRSAAVVKDVTGNVSGSVVATVELGSAFVDGIKHSTGLDSSIYAGKVLTATTLTSSDGKTRPTGVKLSDDKITNQVLKHGNAFSGATNLQHRQMLSAFLPIKDADNVPVGMLLTAQPQSAILLTAGHSVELTFLLTAALLVLSVIPIYYITMSLTRQLT